MAAPTFVAEYESAFTSSGATSKVTSSFDASTDDVLVVIGITSDSSVTLGTPTNTQGALTWTLQQSIVVGNYCAAYVWTAVVGAAKTGMTVTVPKAAGGSTAWGFNLLQYADTDGVGASSKANVNNAAPSLALTTGGANSAIAFGSGDWNAVDGTSRTYRSVNGSAATEQTYFRDSALMTVYIGRHADAGAAGSKTVGVSAPGGQKYAIVAVEILGSAGGGATDLTAADSAHAHATESPALTQVHVLAPVDSAHGHAVESPALTQVHLLAPADSAHGHSTESPSLTQAHALAPAESAHAHAVESPALTQLHLLAPADSAHAHATESPTLTQAGDLEPAESTHGHTSESPALTQTHELAPADSAHGHTTESPALTAAGDLAPDDSAHGHTSDGTSLTQVHILVPADTLHAHITESPTLTGGSTLLPDDSAHGHATESPALTQAHNLTPADSSHGHTVDIAALAQVHALAVLDSLHTHTSTGAAVTIPPEEPPPAERTRAIPAELRVLTIEADPRTATIPAESRTVT